MDKSIAHLIWRSFQLKVRGLKFFLELITSLNKMEKALVQRTTAPTPKNFHVGFDQNLSSKTALLIWMQENSWGNFSLLASKLTIQKISSEGKERVSPSEPYGSRGNRITTWKTRKGPRTSQSLRQLESRINLHRCTSAFEPQYCFCYPIGRGLWTYVAVIKLSRVRVCIIALIALMRKLSESASAH